ncbi:unnamed protein product, partial [Acanthocheilonema viteae]
PTGSKNLEQGAQLSGEMSSSEREEMDERETHADHVPNDEEEVGHTPTFRKAVRSIRKITARRREEVRMLRSYQKRRRKKTRNVSLMSSLTTVADREKDFKIMTGVQQEAEKQQVMIAPMKFIIKPDRTTPPPIESTALISAESTEATVISTQETSNRAECTVLATKPTVPISNTPESTVSSTEPTLYTSNRNTPECTVSTAGLWNIPESRAPAIEPTLHISSRNTPECTVSTAGLWNIPESRAPAIEPTLHISSRNTPECTVSATGLTIPISSTPESTVSAIEPTLHISNRNTPECIALAIRPTVPVSNTEECIVATTGPTVSDNCDVASQSKVRNVDWYESDTPLSITHGSTTSESNRCIEIYTLTYYSLGGKMQSNLSSQQFQSLTTHLDHCLNALRLLRNEVVSVHCRIMEGSWESDPADGEKTLEERLDFINQIYDNLESHAKQLPVSTPMTVQMERLSRFLHDGQIDPHTSELYDKALEASTWMETNNQLLQMYAEFLRTVVGNRRRSIMTDRPISYSNYGLNSSPQSIFEQTLTVVLKDPNIKKIGLVGRYLEKSTLSALVEFKFGQVIDKQYVCLLKMLMVVNSGVPEFVQMIAPHEEWSYLDVGSGQVDIHKESRYLVYRKMSVQANIHLMQTIMPCIDIRNAHTLSYVLNLFAKFSGVFDIKCRVCKKIMKDYLPPLMFDLRCPKNALHESCR